ncbi:MAG: nucleoside hydrolase, partial [Pirellulaceae bacterium]|nr:nucleoside hydrolase [Pirellulaceae bacterium]
MEVRTCLKVLVLVFLPNTVVTGQDPEPSPVIIDTDIGGGIDDALALAAAIMSPELEIRGITIGGSDAGTRARIAGRFLENTAHPRIPVAIGSSDESGTPIDGQRQFARRAGFRGPTRDNAIEFMYEQLKKDPGKITIICLGPPTNVADLIERHPEAKPWIRNLIVWTDQIGDTLAKIREANIPLHGVLPGTITPRLTEPMRKRLFASCTPLSYNLRSLAELSGEDGPSLRGACMIQLVRSPDEPVSTAHSGTDSRQSRDPDRVIDRITSPSPNPRYMPNHVPIVIGGGDYHRLCGYPIEERQIRGLLEELAESLGKPGTIELRVEPDSDEAALDRVAKLCRVAGWTDQRVTLVKRTVSRPIDRKGLPHRVHVFEDYETEIERRWWLAGEPITENLPSGSTRAIRAMPCRNFDGKMGDFYRPYRAVIFNPVPGPPMGPCTRLGFRYHLTGTDRVRVQIYSLSNGYHRSLTLTGLSQGAWHSATVDLTEARRPDGSGGPLAKDERIDD